MAAFVFAVLMMVLDHYTHLAEHIRNMLLNVIQPIEFVAALPKTLYTAYVDSSQSEQALLSQLHALKAEKLILQAKLQYLQELEAENKRLRLLLDATGALPSDHIDLTIATILRTSTQPMSDFVVINKGALDGIAKEMPVLDAHGVFGLVTHTSEFTSQVTLLTDPSLSIPVRIERTGQRAVVQGMGSGHLKVDFIRNSADVRPGDLLVTSGMGGIYPPGYPVARISSVGRPTKDGLLELQAAPISQLYNNHEVLIIRYGTPHS